MTPMASAPVFTAFAATCAHRLCPDTSRRPGNALNVEIAATPADRCAAQPPTSWLGADAYGARWLGSGGSALVFGRCTFARCPAFPVTREETPHVQTPA